MAFWHEGGALVIPSADAAATQYSITGLPPNTKAIMAVMIGDQFTGADFASESADGRISIGFAVGTGAGQRYCVAQQDAQTGDPTICATIWRDDCFGMVMNATDTLVTVDLISFNSDGFTIAKEVGGSGEGGTLLWWAWGGDDITVASVLNFAEPAATGTQNYTVTGFTSGATDQVVIIAGVQSISAVNTDARNDAGLCIGFATGTGAGDQVVTTWNNDDASATTDTDGYCKTGEVVALMVAGGGNATCRAALSAFGTNNFTLNWLARASTRRFIALAMKGGRWKAGATTISGNSGSATATVSGLSFTPCGALLIGRMTAEQSAGTSTAEGRFSIGGGTTMSSRRALGYLHENGAAAAENDLVIEHDQAMAYPSTAGGLQSAYDFDEMPTIDGFRLIVDVAGGVASEWIGYLACGSPRRSLVLPNLHAAHHLLVR